MYPTRLRKPGDQPALATISAEAVGRLLRHRIEFERGCDELEALAFVRVDGLEPGECKVYRVRQMADGKVTGGYTIVALRQ